MWKMERACMAGEPTVVRIIAGISICVLALAGVGLARADTAGTGGGSDGTPSPSDQQVLESIQKGVDFLLKDMYDRLEPARQASADKLSDPTLLHGEIGSGEFTLEAYALLHAGRDLND